MENAPRTPAPPRVLVVDDERGVRSLLCRALARAGFAVDEAVDGAEALARLGAAAPASSGAAAPASSGAAAPASSGAAAPASSGAAALPAVAVLDLVLPDRHGLDLLADLKRLDPGIAVIVITGGGDEEAALRAGAASFYRKPFLAADIVQEVRRLAAWRAVPPSGPATAGPRGRSIATAEARDLSLVGDLTLPLRGLLDDDALLGVRIGIGEMIANAVEHGNLGISASEKEEALAAGRFPALLAERLALPGNAERRVHVETHLADGEFRVTVRDEGAGFDWRGLAAEPGATIAGRGVLLARVHFDALRWNERGNEVTLVKRLPRARG